MRTWKSITAGIVAGIAAFVSITAGPASASTDLGGHPDFAEQAKSLGLTQAQADALQDRADGYLARLPGMHPTQVSINKIRFDGGDVLLTLPGEQQVRELDSQPDGVTVQTHVICVTGAFCGFQYQNLTGDRVGGFDCVNIPIPWLSRGSWINAQTGNTKAQFKDSSNITRWTSPDPVSIDTDADWSWVAFVKPC